MTTFDSTLQCDLSYGSGLASNLHSEQGQPRAIRIKLKDHNLRGVGYGKGQFVGVGESGTILTSADENRLGLMEQLDEFHQDGERLHSLRAWFIC